MDFEIGYTTVTTFKHGYCIVLQQGPEGWQATVSGVNGPLQIWSYCGKEQTALDYAVEYIEERENVHN